ncbi:MAG TPA: GNAT family N-acetyltransferase [Micromonosporaceae bacterium]
MPDHADRVAAAYAAAADLSDVGGVSAVVAGVPCLSLGLPYRWATQARPLARRSLPGPSVVAELVGWLTARAPQWTIVVRREHATALDGFTTAEVLPAFRLAVQPPQVRPPDGLAIGPARDAAEFLAVYGADLAPLVTERHLAAAGHHHLVARLGGSPVGCARVRIQHRAGYVSGVTVLPAYRRIGIGTALSAAASRLAGVRTDLVWLHANASSRSIYQRLGYVHVDDHVQLVPMAQANSAK